MIQREFFEQVLARMERIAQANERMEQIQQAMSDRQNALHDLWREQAIKDTERATLSIENEKTVRERLRINMLEDKEQAEFAHEYADRQRAQWHDHDILLERAKGFRQTRRDDLNEFNKNPEEQP